MMRKNLKKGLAVLTAAAMCASMAACGNTGSGKQEASDTTKSAESTASSEADKTSEETGSKESEKAEESTKDLYGFETNAIVTMADVVEHLYNRPCQGRVLIDDTCKAAIDAYYVEYGAK